MPDNSNLSTTHGVKESVIIIDEILWFNMIQNTAEQNAQSVHMLRQSFHGYAQLKFWV